MRLEVLRLMATMIADEARDIEDVKVKTAQPKRSKQLPALPIPKSANTASVTARLRTYKAANTYSAQIALTLETDVRVCCIGGVKHVCACRMGFFEGRVR